MKTYWVLWTYIANYSRLMCVEEAKSPEEAIQRTTGYFGADFQQKATVYVFDHKPALVVVKGEKVGPSPTTGNYGDKE